MRMITFSMTFSIVISTVVALKLHVLIEFIVVDLSCVLTLLILYETLMKALYLQIPVLNSQFNERAAGITA